MDIQNLKNVKEMSEKLEADILIYSGEITNEGEIQRAIRVALAYGERLILKRGNLPSTTELVKLVQGYPDHGFVIDYEEAKQIFKVVRKHDELEEIFGKSLEDLKYPASHAMIKKIHPGENYEESNKRANLEGVRKVNSKTRKTDCGDNGAILPIHESEKSTA